MSASGRDPPPLIGEAPVFLDMLAHVSRLAALSRPVVVVGERGTGKELVAARLHFLSPRWDRPFVRINCAAMGETLIESALFGHEAGSFTGAIRRHIGQFERAFGGTLFLDEVATASPRLQERLLRVIEYGEFERVGGTQTLFADVRVVAATNADLPAMVASGQFRADLLDRLAFAVVSLPPLRERRADIPLLARHFALAMTKELRRSLFPGFTPTAMEALCAGFWPGNVRQLRCAVERAVALAGDAPDQLVDRIVADPFASEGAASLAPAASATTDTAALPAAAGDALPFHEQVATFERVLLHRALRHHQHNQRKAAASLGLGYHQLRRLLQRHGLAGTGADEGIADGLSAKV